LGHDQFSHVEKILKEFQCLFSFAPGTVPDFEHVIDTGVTKPIKSHPQPMTPAKLQILSNLLKELLLKDTIEEVSGPWAANPVIVPEPNGKWRLCIDYCPLNQATVADSYPMPRIDDILTCIGGAKYISTFDIPGGGKYLVYFYSRNLNTAERNYSVSEKECLGVVEAMKRFRCIEYTHFIVETDHQALCWLKGIKKPTGRLAFELQGYDFDVVYKSGSQNRTADVLSRAPVLLLEESKLKGITSCVCQKHSGPFISSDKYFESNNEYTCPVLRNIVGVLRVSHNKPFFSRNRSQQDVNEGRSGLEEVPVCDVSNGPEDPVRKGVG
jgi:hypothetical protein